MSQNPNKEISNEPLSEDEWLKFYRLMDNLEKKVSAGESLSKDEAEFFEKCHKVYQLHMELAKHTQEIDNLAKMASNEIERINKHL